jgi:hypothetical protein
VDTGYAHTNTRQMLMSGDWYFRDAPRVSTT